jgi:GNAT superfamily N-acetyltransferase
MQSFDFQPLTAGHHPAVTDYLVRHGIEPLAPLAYNGGWLAIVGQTVVGVALALESPSVDGNGSWCRLQLHVEPGLRRQAIGGHLLDRMEHQLALRGPARVLVSLQTDDPAGRFLRSRGFVELPAIAHFSIRLPMTMPSSLSSAGTLLETITKYDGNAPSTDQRIVDLFNLAYTEMIGVTPMVATRLAAGLQTGRYRCHLCRSQDELRGFAMWFASTARRAYLACLVVAPEFRGRGLGDALTFAVANTSLQAGFQTLDTDLPPHIGGQTPYSDVYARRLAARLGFEIIGTSPCFEHLVVPKQGPSSLLTGA